MRPISLLSVIAVLSACVTVNVYFPAAAAERAADRLICDVYGVDCGADGASERAPMPDTGPAAEPARQTPPPTPEGEPQSLAPAPAGGHSLALDGVRQGVLHLAAGVLDLLVPAAHAQQPDINVSSPAIATIEAALEARYGELKPHYVSGAVGLKSNGLIELRDPAAVDLRARNRVKQLVADENRDRNALYREIASANGHPEWEASIREIFARRWVANAPGGWFYEERAGVWRQK